MAKNPLSREYGVLFGVCGPLLLERAHWYRALAKRVEAESPRAAQYMMNHAERAETTIDSLAKGLEDELRGSQ